MTEKRFQLNKDCEWWFVKDNTIKVNEYGYRDDLTGEDEYRGLKQELTEEETVELMNELYEENIQVKDILKEYNNLDCFIDSAMGIGFIERIALALGVDLE